MGELKKGLKELKGFASHRKNNNIHQPDTLELPGTKPSNKEYTGKDLWVQLHMSQSMALSGSNGKTGPWSCDDLMPSLGECQGVEARVTGRVGKHPHKSDVGG
jgi:hypothetical protein